MRQNQRGFHHLFIILTITVVAAIVMIGLYIHAHQKSSTSDGQVSLTKQQIASLPDISYYQTHKSDQFIVDMSLVKSGHPFKGQGAALPHAGAHAQFGDSYLNWPQGGSAPQNYPPVYSAVDGYISKITPRYSDPTKADADLYFIDVAFAKSGTDVWSLHYSFEPYVKEPTPGYFAKFIDVTKGQQVHKGDVIAHMYLNKDGGNNEHIHFHLAKSNDYSNFYAPAIFTPDVVEQFRQHWGEFGINKPLRSNDGTPIPVCMGFKLAANENPFGTGATDCLL